MICGNNNHQISNYPKKQPRENSTQQVDGTKSKQANEKGNRTRVPAQIYAVDKPQASESSEATEGKISMTKFLMGESV